MLKHLSQEEKLAPFWENAPKCFEWRYPSSDFLLKLPRIVDEVVTLTEHKIDVFFRFVQELDDWISQFFEKFQASILAGDTLVELVQTEYLGYYMTLMYISYALATLLLWWLGGKWLSLPFMFSTMKDYLCYLPWLSKPITTSGIIYDISEKLLTEHPSLEQIRLVEPYEDEVVEQEEASGAAPAVNEAAQELFLCEASSSGLPRGPLHLYAETNSPTRAHCEASSSGTSTNEKQDSKGSSSSSGSDTSAEAEPRSRAQSSFPQSGYLPSGAPVSASAQVAVPPTPPQPSSSTAQTIVFAVVMVIIAWIKGGGGGAFGA